MARTRQRPQGGRLALDPEPVVGRAHELEHRPVGPQEDLGLAPGTQRHKPVQGTHDPRE